MLALPFISAMLSGCHSNKSDGAPPSASSVVACLKVQQDKGEYGAVSQCVATGPSEIMSGTWVSDFETSWYFNGNINVIDLSKRQDIPSLLFGNSPFQAGGPVAGNRQAFRVRFVGRKTAAGASVSAVLVDRLLSIQAVSAPSIIRSR
ncbi:hypothetical protein [Sphingomonas oryzagri]